jgi:crossover junction endodeoxyribonuclease RuvC
MRVMGIDPGLSGGLALIDTRTGEVVVDDMPVLVVSSKKVRVKKGKKAGTLRKKDKLTVDGKAVGDWVEKYEPDVAVVEAVASRPEQGVVSVFAFGEAFGAVCGAVAAMNIPVQRVAPSVWKRRLGLIGVDKKASLKVARKLYKRAEARLGRVKDNGRAEALLIAHYSTLNTKSIH